MLKKLQNQPSRKKKEKLGSGLRVSMSRSQITILTGRPWQTSKSVKGCDGFSFDKSIIMGNCLVKVTSY